MSSTPPVQLPPVTPAGSASLGRTAHDPGALLPEWIEGLLRDAAGALLPLLPARVPVVRLTGAAADGTPLVAVAAGPAAAFAYWERRLFAAPPRRTPLGRVPVHALRGHLARVATDAELVLVRLDRRRAHDFARTEYLVVPEWVAARAPVPADVATLKRNSGNVAEDFRRVRRARFTARLSTDAAELATFYRRMYLPYVHVRYGAETHAHTLPRLARAFRRGGLLVVERDGLPLAGHLFARAGDVLHSVAVGVLDGDVRLVKEGIAAALYVHLFRHAIAERCAWIDLRGSRPSLQDGVLRYKRKWGAIIAPKRDVVFATCVGWRDLAGGAGAFLRAHGLVFETGRGLSGFAVQPGPDQGAAALARLRESLWVPGLQQLVLAASGPHAEVAPSGTAVVDARHCSPSLVHAALRGARQVT